MNTSLTPSANVDVDGFAMLNLSAGVSTDKWRAALFADNVTNTRGILSANSIEPDRRPVDLQPAEPSADHRPAPELQVRQRVTRSD